MYVSRFMRALAVAGTLAAAIAMPVYADKGLEVSADAGGKATPISSEPSPGYLFPNPPPFPVKDGTTTPWNAVTLDY